MKKQNINIILANATLRDGNKGCTALCVTMMLLIDQIMKEAGQKYTLYLPDSFYFDSQIHEIDLNGTLITFSDCEYHRMLSRTETLKRTILNVLKRKNPKTIFEKADYILDIGQGDSFSDIYGERRFRAIDRIHQIAQEYKKTYCILPQTIGPFSDAIIAETAHSSIQNATMCMARDRQSMDYVLKNVPLQRNIKEYIDIAFFMPYRKIVHEDGYTHVGLNVSALLWNGGYTRDNQFGLKDDYQCIVHSIIDHFIEQPQTKLHLISHVVGAERNIENDYEVCYHLWKEYSNPRVVLAPFPLDPIEIKGYIAGLDFFMGARMHSTIAAFSTGVPVVPMAYSRKFNGLFEDTLGYLHLVDLKSHSLSESLSIIKRSYIHAENLKNEIDNINLSVVENKKDELINDLKKFFNLK